MFRYPLAIVASVAILSSTSGTAAVQTADEIVEKHLAALGGRAALGKLTSRRATGTVTLGTQAGDIPGTIELSAKPPNKVRVLLKLDLSALGAPDPMVIDQKFDGTAGWSLNSLQGDTPITGNQLENMRNNAFPTPLMGYKEAGSKLEALPRETVGGKELLVIRLTPKVGSAVTMYLDPATFLLVRSVARVSTAEAGDLDQVSELSDYRDVGGVKTAFQIKNSNQVQTVTIRLEKIEHNVTLDDAIFSVRSPRP